MRVFVAGASGVIGSRIVPLLCAAGHEVGAMTRSSEKADDLAALGTTPVVCDVYDAAELRRVMVGFGPELVLHQLTDLPDDADALPGFGARNARIRREGTANLIAAARAAGATRFAAQSVAWTIPGDGGAAVRELEAAVLGSEPLEGLVLRYGRFYGPGTYYETDAAPPPRVHVGTAAERSVAALFDARPGVVTIVDPEP